MSNEKPVRIQPRIHADTWRDVRRIAAERGYTLEATVNWLLSLGVHYLATKGKSK